jgi:hypothetical protein
MKTIMRGVVTLLVVALAGCASKDNAVRCDGRLEPINAVVSREKPVVSDSETEAARPRHE